MLVTLYCGMQIPIGYAVTAATFPVIFDPRILWSMAQTLELWCWGNRWGSPKWVCRLVWTWVVRLSRGQSSALFIYFNHSKSPYVHLERSEFPRSTVSSCVDSRGSHHHAVWCSGAPPTFSRKRTSLPTRRPDSRWLNKKSTIFYFWKWNCL
jgi:hypothetical protein